MGAEGVIVVVTCLGAGFFVGATSLGGFLVAPLLVLVLGRHPTEAVAIALAAFLPGGAFGAAIYMRRGWIDLQLVALLVLAGLPGIGVGLVVSRSAPDAVLRSILALALLVGCVRLLAGLRGSGGAHAVGAAPGVRPWRHGARPAILGVLACIAGFAATTAGIGGALVLVPILLGMDVPPRIAAGTGIAVSTAFGVLGVCGHLGATALDWTLLVVITTACSLGLLIGASQASRLPPRSLIHAMLALCAVAGLSMLA